MTLSELVSLLTEENLHLPPVPAEILDITYSTSSQECCKVYGDKLLLPFASSPLVHLPVKHAEVLCQGHDVKTIIEITLDNKDEAIKFKAGDTIGLLPQNCEDEVNYLLKRLNLENKGGSLYNLSLKNVKGTKKIVTPQHLPLTGRLKDVLLSCIDLRSVLKKVFIGVLSLYTENALERRCLEELCSKEGSQIYNEHILNKHTNILDLLQKYPSCNPPISLLFQHLPRLMPRPYSVCNTYNTDDNVIKICFSVVNIESTKKGIATGWMERITNRILKEKSHSTVDLLSSKLENIDLNAEDISFPVYLRKSNMFCLPSDMKKPIIMIALGTGVAPFIGFLSERRHLINSSAEKDFGETVLYFGCRFYEKDFIYKKDLEGFVNCGFLTKLRTSFSREDDCKSKYVQDNIEQDAEYLVKLIDEQDAVIYACGDIHKINSDIDRAIAQCFCRVRQIEMEEAMNMVATLKTAHRYILDVWS